MKIKRDPHPQHVRTLKGMANNISDVKRLLKVFGFDSVKTSRLEKLAEEKALAFQKLAQESKEYVSHTTHKTDKIFLIMAAGSVEPLMYLGDIYFLEEPAKSLQPKINSTAEKHNITGSLEKKLYRVVKDGHMVTLTDDDLFREPVSFARAVFMVSGEKKGYLLKDDTAVEKLKKDAGVSSIVCNVHKFHKKDATLPAKEKLTLLEKRTKATLQTIQEFLSLSPSAAPSSPSKEKKEKKKERKERKENKPKKVKKPVSQEPMAVVVVEKVSDLISPLIPVPVVVEKTYIILNKNSDYATALEWFDRCPVMMQELLLV